MWKLRLRADDPGLDPSLCAAYEPWIATPNFMLIQKPDPQRIVATWVGHSTFLIQMGGLNLLTDPHFGAFCSPLPLRRFRRQTPPGLSIAQLPRIDAILLSHNHYDHLDLASLRELAPETEIYCPSGVGRLLRGLGARRIFELGWNESARLQDVRLICVPAQHGSARTPFDRNRSLWCGWGIESSTHRALFTGDTGYSPILKEIGARLGPIDLAMIPIGAYRPGWFMRPVHLNPSEAVQAHLDLGSKQSLAMHWGAFQLADEPFGEPALLLEQARKTAGVSPEAFYVLGIGETKLF